MVKEKQMELAGMPADSKLGKLGKKLAAKLEDVAEQKLEIHQLEKDVLALMKTEKVKRFKISDGVSQYELKQVESSEHVRCAKITKQRRDHADE